MNRWIYLDHSATTPVRPEVWAGMQDSCTKNFGNPSSLHTYGRKAREGIEQARSQLATAINASAEDIFFTSGGTEADNLAIIGTARANRSKGRHIIISQIEHHAVLDSAKYLEAEGFRTTLLPVDPEGRISPAELEQAIEPDTILVSIMHANNEIGTIQPMDQIAEIKRRHGFLFHTDAVQSLGKIPVDVESWGVDLLSASAHKIYGPKGVGCLYIRPGVKLEPFFHGGSQEDRLRPGTENAVGIIGFGLAANLAVAEMQILGQRLDRLRERLWQGLKSRVEGMVWNGSYQERVPGHLNISFSGAKNGEILWELDQKGILASAGSACTSEEAEPSHVLMALGITLQLAHSAVRISLGRDNNDDDIDLLLEVLPPVIERSRNHLIRMDRPGCNCSSR